jgi:hypothetical protein
VAEDNLPGADSLRDKESQNVLGICPFFGMDFNSGLCADSGVRSSFSPLIHILEGEKVWHQVITPMQ